VPFVPFSRYQRYYLLWTRCPAVSVNRLIPWVLCHGDGRVRWLDLPELATGPVLAARGGLIERIE